MKEVMAKTAQYAAKEAKCCKGGAVLFCNTWARKTGIYPGKCFDKYGKIWKHKQNPLNCHVMDKNISVTCIYHVKFASRHVALGLKQLLFSSKRRK
jgi:hypothetical protein